MAENSTVRDGVEVVPDDESGVQRCGRRALSARVTSISRVQAATLLQEWFRRNLGKLTLFAVEKISSP